MKRLVLYICAFCIVSSAFAQRYDYDDIYFNPKKDYTGVVQESTYYPIVALVFAFGGMALCDLIEKKFNQKWMGNFALGFSMILGMAAAIVAQMIG